MSVPGLYSVSVAVGEKGSNRSIGRNTRPLPQVSAWRPTRIT